MAVKHQVLDMSPLGMKFTVLQSSSDTNGASLELYWEVLPGCNMKEPLIHIHPNAIETYEVIEGEIEFYIRNKWIKASKGEKFTVEKGIAHSFRNSTKNTVTVFNTHQPALKMENYFEDACTILTKITNNRKVKFRMNLKARVYMSILMGNYRNEIIAKSPPDIAIRILGWIGKILNIKY